MDRGISSGKDVTLRKKKSNLAYQYRRKSKIHYDQYSADLKHVLGLTLKSNCAFGCDPNTGFLAYPAGCVIVLHNPRNGKQFFVFNPGQKTITCLHFSRDGNYMVTGESGHQPCVRVFSLSDRQQIASFGPHKYGVSCVKFSPNQKYVVSIGYQHDNVINVWDWKKNVLAATNKVSTKIKALSFSDDSNYFVTVGNRHVKFWYLEKASTPDNYTVPLKGRSAILENLRNHLFCDVVCGVGTESELTFALTRSGLLCQFSAKRSVVKHVVLKNGSGRSIAIMNDTILCGCGNGNVLAFSTSNLELLTNIRCPDIARGHEILATSIDVCNMWLHTVFADHSLVISDIMDLQNVQVTSVSQFHNSCVWDIYTLPQNDVVGDFASGFLTCSNDGTVRIWNLHEQSCKLMKVIRLQGQSDAKTDLDNLPKVEARSLCVRHDEKHVAVGDRSGNIHVYDLETFERVAFIPTHDGDVLCLSYSQSGTILASASRDRCVHTFGDGYSPTHTIADHSAAVTAVKFAEHENQFRLMTCGADKSLYFCAISGNSGKTDISREQHFVEKHSMGDMAVVDDSVIVACGCNLSEYDIFGARLKRTFRGNEAGSNILRVAVDVQGTLLATSCVDKNIYVLGYMTAECLCVINGHSEVAVALAFDADSHLLSTSADSCIFVWSLRHRVGEDIRHLQSLAGSTSNLSTPDSPDLNKTSYFASDQMLSMDIPEESVQETPRSVNGDMISALFGDNMTSQDASEITFDVSVVDDDDAESERAKIDESLLPAWVTKQHGDDESVAPSNQPSASLGKWGSGLEQDKICEEIGNLAQLRDLQSVASSYDDESILFELKVEFSDDEAEGSDDVNPALLTEGVKEKDKNGEVQAKEAQASGFPIPFDRTYTKKDFANLKPNKAALDSNPSVKSISSEHTANEMDSANVTGVTPTRPSHDLKALSETLSENARISEKIAAGLDPVALESPSEELAQRDLGDSFEHVDVRKTLYLQKNGEREKPARSSGKDSSNVDTRESETPSNDSDATKPLVCAEQTSSSENRKYQIESSAIQGLDDTLKAKDERKAETDDEPSRFTVSSQSDFKSDDEKGDLIKSTSFLLVENAIAEAEAEQEIGAENDEECIPGKYFSDDSVEFSDRFSPEMPDAGGSPLTQDQYRGLGFSSESEEDKTSAESSHPADDSASTSISAHSTSTVATKKPHTPKPSNAIPPAFVELLESLARRQVVKKARNPPKSLPLKINYSPEQPRQVKSDCSVCANGQAAEPAQDNFNDTASASETNNNNNYYLSGSLMNGGASEDVECEKASNDLLNQFQHAEAMYHKCKDEGSGDSQCGVGKLAEAFRTIHNRIGNLNLVESKIPATSSLDDVSDGSPVFSLLREYSDRLVTMVHQQVGPGKIRSTQSDTV